MWGGHPEADAEPPAFQFYLLYGVRLVWVVDPVRATVAVLVPGGEQPILTAGDTLDGGEVLPGFSVLVDEVFAQTHA